MFTRRKALQLGTVGLASPLSSLSKSCAWAQHPHFSPTSHRRSAFNTGEEPGHGPKMDSPIVVKWRFTLEERADPVVAAAGMVYASSSAQHLYAIDAENGQEKWRFTSEAGLNNNPTLDASKVFIRSALNLHAIDMISGLERWRYPLDASGSLPATVFQETVYIQDTPHLRAIEAESGIQKWDLALETAARFLAPVVVANGATLVAGWTDAGNQHYTLGAFDAQSGQELWKHEVADLGPPIASGKSILIYGEIENSSYYQVLDAHSGEMLSQFEVPGKPTSVPIVNDDILIFAHQSALHVFDVETGQALWRLSHPAGRFATAAIDGDIVYACSVEEEYSNTSFLPIAAEGRLNALDLLSGEEHWSFDFGEAEYPDYVAFTPTIADGNIYLNSFDGQIIAIGNYEPSVLASDVTLRGAPSDGGVERGTANVGDTLDKVGTRTESNGQEWVEVTTGDVTGWIPLDAIDPETLPPAGETEYIYSPE